jgi:hypothetical protein
VSYAFEYDVPANEQFYQRVKAEIGDEKPRGLVAHLVVKRDGGLRHIEVWESKEDWERFRQERAEPALDKVFAAAGIAPRPPRPQEQELPLVDAVVGN